MGGIDCRREGDGRRRILLIADDLEPARTLAGRIDNLGFETVLVSASPVANPSFPSGSSGPAIGAGARAEAGVEAVIIDISTPIDEVRGRDGFAQALAWAGALPPRVFLSACGNFQTRLEAVRLGAACFLVKPIDVIELSGTLQRLTQREREAPLRALIVSGRGETAETMAAPLADIGFDTKVAIDPVSAVDTLDCFQPDVMVLDHEVPGCASHELAAVIRQLPILHARVPIVFVTGEHNAIAELLATRAAGDDLLRRPVEIGMLRSSALARARRFREITALARRHRANEERLRALTYSAGDAVISIDDASVITYWNPAAERMFGYGPEAAIGWPLARLMPECSHATHCAGVNRLSASAVGTSDSSPYHGRVLEMIGRHRDGTEFPIEVSISRWNDGDRVAFSGLVRDITRRRQLERQLELSRSRFQDFAEVSSDYFWETDTEDHFTYISGRFEELFGIPVLFALGCGRRDLWTAFGPHEFEENLGTLAAFERAEAARRPYDKLRIAWHHLDGAPRFVSVSGKPVFDPDGRYAGYRGAGVDVTEAVLAERAIRAARDEAERANQAKSEFLSAMSHELRTPLNSIIGFSQLLQTISDPPLHGKPLTYVDYILRASHHLLELINEVLDLAKIETGRLALELDDISPWDLVEDCIAIAEPLARDRRITIESRIGTDRMAVVRGDYRRSRQALLNFLSNAVKYNHDGGQIVIMADPRGADGCRFSVQDSGIGIPRGKQDRLFEPFNRLGAEALGVEGTGIGLALTRRLVEGMGGSIGFTSEENRGSLFWFELPGLRIVGRTG